jgi:hypothetical protein
MIGIRQLVVSEFSSRHKDRVCPLELHHGSNPPSLEFLHFKINQSEKFGFSVPDWFAPYSLFAQPATQEEKIRPYLGLSTNWSSGSYKWPNCSAVKRILPQ